MGWSLSLISNGILEINEYIKSHKQLVTDFLHSKTYGFAPPIFTSVDIRYAGFKMAPVDTNLFPAGFNNLSLKGLEICAIKIKNYFRANFPNVKKVLIFPENFTRNLRYFENLDTLLSIFKLAGLEAVVSSFIADLEADLIVLNNDLTNGIPEALVGCDIPIIPDVNLGWHIRRKHKHFLCYNQIIQEFNNLSGFDPWLLSTEFEHCKNIDFRNRIGFHELAEKVDRVLERVKKKYQQYAIHEKPFVFVKADQGTYGMGILVAYDGSDIHEINKKNRHSMQSIKQGLANTTIIVQEGVPTIEKYQDATSESLVYLCESDPIETFSRWHSKKDPYTSLNSPGMHFSLQEDELLSPLKNFLAQIASVSTVFECR